MEDTTNAEVKQISIEEAKKAIEFEDRRITDAFRKEYEALCDKYSRQVAVNFIIATKN